MTTRVIRDESELRELLGEPTDIVSSKVSDRLNELTRRFVERSPFVCLATSAPEGSCDEIDEAFTHCSKAFIRSGLWDPTTFVDRSELPSSGEVLASLRTDAFDAEEYDRARAERYARREGLY